MGDRISVGIKPHIRPNIVQGIGSWWQRFPRTALELGSLIGFTPSNIWPLNEASGNFSDLIGAESLTPVNAPAQGQATPFAGQYQVEFSDGTLDSADAVNAAAFDYNNVTSFAWLAVVRLTFTGGVYDILARRSGGTAYYRCYITAGGTLIWYITDGVTPAVCSFGVTLPLDYLPLLCVVDRNAVAASLSIPGTTNSASTLLVGNLNNAGPFSIGSRTSFAMTSDFVYLAHFTGVNAQMVGSEQQILTDFWRGI